MHQCARIILINYILHSISIVPQNDHQGLTGLGILYATSARHILWNLMVSLAFKMDSMDCDQAKVFE